MKRPHLRLEVGRWWFQIGRDDDEPEHESPPFIDHHPTPQVIYAPERVGFYQLPDEGD